MKYNDELAIKKIWDNAFTDKDNGEKIPLEFVSAGMILTSTLLTRDTYTPYFLTDTAIQDAKEYILNKAKDTPLKTVINPATKQLYIEEFENAIKPDLLKNKWTLEEFDANQINWTSQNDYTPTNWVDEIGAPVITLKPGEFTTIAGHTGIGKSHLLINWAIDELEQKINLAEQKNTAIKPTYFLSLEMPRDDVARRFMFNIMYKLALKDDTSETHKDIALPVGHAVTNDLEYLQIAFNKICAPGLNEGDLQPIKKVDELELPLRASYRRVENWAKTHPNESPENFLKYYNKARRVIKQWVEMGYLVIMDCNQVNNDIHEIEKLAKGNENASFYIDYLQLLYDKTQNPTQQNLVIKSVCNEMRRIAIDYQLKIVTASQFNREGTKGKADLYPEDLQLYCLAEGADIERASANVIGIGYINAPDKKRQYYYKVLKQRKGNHTNKAYKLGITTNLAYSYIAPHLDANNIGCGVLENRTRDTTNEKNNQEKNNNIKTFTYGGKNK